MFTRLSQFTYGNYVIPNLQTETTNNNSALLIHVQKYEQEGLRMVIGDCLYDEFMDNLEIGEDGFYVLKEGVDEKWGWLLNGHNYESENNLTPGCGCVGSNCIKRKWDGIVKTVATISDVAVKESILAPYIFYNWSLNYRSLNTGVGEGKGVADGTIPVPSANKRTDAWNEFVQKVSFGFTGSRVSLYQFLNDHKTEFPDFQAACFNTITYWDI